MRLLAFLHSVKLTSKKRKKRAAKIGAQQVCDESADLQSNIQEAEVRDLYSRVVMEFLRLKVCGVSRGHFDRECFQALSCIEVCGLTKRIWTLPPFSRHSKAPGEPTCFRKIRKCVPFVILRIERRRFSFENKFSYGTAL